jgi:hypothetical protein
MIDQEMLRRWIARRKKKLNEGAKQVQLPGGMVINIHLPLQGQQGQQLPLSPDGKSVATRDSVSRFPG